MITVAFMGLTATIGGGLLLTHADAAYRDVRIPIQSLTRKQWLDFVKTSSNGNPRTITPTFRLGAFELSVKRLCDLGVMRNPRQVAHAKKQVWDAEWIYPKTLKEFQADPMLQYSLFAESVRRYATDPALLAHVGCNVAGLDMTLSGVLAVAHRMGLQGLAGWVAYPSKRERYTHTMNYFQRANGIF